MHHVAPEYARVCQSMQEYAKVCKSIAKVCQSSAQVIPMSSPSCLQVIISDAQWNPWGIHEASTSSPVIAFI